jgi:hypothetical protein
MTKAELDYSRSLMAETNSILAGLDSSKIRDAINWGHLGCTAVEKVKTFSGNATSIEWRVLIEEASPDAYEFRTLVAEELARRGYSGVAVVTELRRRSGQSTEQFAQLIPGRAIAGPRSIGPLNAVTASTKPRR